MGIWQRLFGRFRRKADLLNLEIAPAYAIKASQRNPYFQRLEQTARDAGYLGSFIIDAEGHLRPGHREGIETRHATLALDVYPNPAAIEGRTVADYEDSSTPRRAPRATLVLDDDSELLLWATGGHLCIAGPALQPRFPEENTGDRHGDHRLRGHVRG